MIGDYLNMNKKKDVKTRADQVMFNGKKYRREEATRLLCMYDWVEKEVA